MEREQGDNRENCCQTNVKKQKLEMTEDAADDAIVNEPRAEYDEIATKRLAYIVEFATSAKETVPYIRQMVKKMANRGISLTMTTFVEGKTLLAGKLEHNTPAGCDVLFETRRCDGLSLLMYTHANSQTVRSMVGVIRSESESITGTEWPNDPLAAFSFKIRERDNNKFQTESQQPPSPHAGPFCPSDPIFIDFDKAHDKWAIDLTPKAARNNNNERHARTFNYFKLLIHSLLHRKTLHVTSSGRVQLRDETEDHNCGIFETRREDGLVLLTVLAPAYSKQIAALLKQAVSSKYKDVESVLSLKMRQIKE